MIADLLGGIGLFLLGMMLMTEGMEEAAGEGLHALLKRATGNGVRGTVFGATLTLVVQSSTASTLATIGFARPGCSPSTSRWLSSLVPTWGRRALAGRCR